MRIAFIHVVCVKVSVHVHVVLKRVVLRRDCQYNKLLFHIELCSVRLHVQVYVELGG